MYLLGIDIGTSSIKAAVVDAESGICIASASSPDKEMEIIVPFKGWAEQHPETWWEHTAIAVQKALIAGNISGDDISAIGITYQMHGLVLVDKDGIVLRPAIIWCDSRAVGIGKKAFREIGEKICLSRLLNSPGNFTASKLRWIKENEPELFAKIHKVLLPGDYISFKLTNEYTTTVSGLSEAILWDFQDNRLSDIVLNHYDFKPDLLPKPLSSFSYFGKISCEAASFLQLNVNARVCYKAGDQPNNAFSLNVLYPGEVAATAGTSGVIYGVTDQLLFDPKSRVNTFAHVNHSPEKRSLGVLLCINGCGILNNWLRSISSFSLQTYDEMNKTAALAPIGSRNLKIFPFGNGAERMLEDRLVGAMVADLDLNIHDISHLARAAQEGIACAFRYGMDIMKEYTGISAEVIRAGEANMFLSPVFTEAMANLLGTAIELYQTDGSVGAARGAGIGAGIFLSNDDAFRNLRATKRIEPEASKRQLYESYYSDWLDHLHKLLK